MSKKRKKRKKRPQAPSKPPKTGGGIGFLLGAIGFGVACIVAGVLVIVLRISYTREVTEMSLTQTSTIGYWLIALGAMAVILSIVIYRTKK